MAADPVSGLNKYLCPEMPAPTLPSCGADVIVDACQARIGPEIIAAYLTRGWPVVVTGSKFFGGPAFSGAVLFPRARERRIGGRDLPTAAHDAANLGTALRWTAALAVIDSFEPQVANMAAALLDRSTSIEQAVASNPELVPIRGLRPRGPDWAGLPSIFTCLPSIFTFGVRDPTNRDRLLSVTGLRPLYERLARRGVLLGQPVGLGTFGGLRIAVGARDLLNRSGDGAQRRIFSALEEETAPPRRQGGVRSPACL